MNLTTHPLRITQQNHRDMRRNLLQSAYQLIPIHLRHRIISQHQINLGSGKNADRLLAGASGKDLVSVSFQHELEYGKLLFIVVYAENHFLWPHGVETHSLIQFLMSPGNTSPAPALVAGWRDEVCRIDDRRRG